MMSLRLVDELARAPLPKVGGIARAVLIELAMFADDDGSRCFPSLETLAARTQICRRSIVAALHALHAAKLIQKEHRIGQTGRYRIDLNQCRRCTGALGAPVQEMHQTSAGDALQPVQEMHPTQSTTQSTTQSKRGKPRKPPFSVPESDLPFRSPRFLALWRDREQQLREKHCPLTPSVAKSQLAKLVRMGEAMALEALENAISGNWQGVFAPKHGSNGKHQTHNRGNRNRDTANQFVPEDAYDLSKRPTEPDDESLDDKPF